MSTEQHSIQGITGVDVTLPIAGPGSRSYAFIIDWHIRVLIALAWMAAALIIEVGSLRFPAAGVKRETTAILAAFVLPAVIYFFYHPVLELLMHGQSPGKRMAGVRVVTVDGGTPGFGAILIRNIFRLIDALPAFYFVGTMTTLFSAQRVRIGDMAAGTLLVIDDRSSSRYLERAASAPPDSKLDFPIRDLIEQLLERWPSLAVDKRDAIARSLLKKAGAASGIGDLELLDDRALHDRLSTLSYAADTR
jgi:uncharacterized RDD family membrane protein YckC